MAFNIFIIEMTLLLEGVTCWTMDIDMLLFQLVVSRFVKLILWSGQTIMHEIQGLAFLLSVGINYWSEEAINY